MPNRVQATPRARNHHQTPTGHAHRPAPCRPAGPGSSRHYSLQTSIGYAAAAGEASTVPCPPRRGCCTCGLRASWPPVRECGRTSWRRPWRACRRSRGRGRRRASPAARSRPPSRRSRGPRPTSASAQSASFAATLASTWRLRWSMLALTSLALADGVSLRPAPTSPARLSAAVRDLLPRGLRPTRSRPACARGPTRCLSCASDSAARRRPAPPPWPPRPAAAAHPAACVEVRVLRHELPPPLRFRASGAEAPC